MFTMSLAISILSSPCLTMVMRSLTTCPPDSLGVRTGKVFASSQGTPSVPRLKYVR